MAADSITSTSDSPHVEARRVREIRERFMAVQADRMARVRQVLQGPQQQCLAMLPLLLHVNDPHLPGYVAEDTPCGIMGYSPDPQILKVARRQHWQFSGHVAVRRESPAVVSLSLMGSSGSIAQSVRSDLDLWLCHRSGISDEAMAQLREKCDLIEAWARSFNLELHIFPMNAESFRGGERETLNGEYCGSSQHYLLLDEFYRTGILLAGATPVWWYVPPELEDQYEAVVDDLFSTGKVQSQEVVDFGPINRMPLAEFLGAAMWQLYKGIDSPWKSMLKLLLLECYLDDMDSQQGMLCHEFKRRVYAEDNPSPERLDPYIMLYERLEAYLLNEKQETRLELARQCFYQKVGLPLSKPLSKGRSHWRREMLRNLTDSWDWTPGTLFDLDNRDSWGIEQALAARHEVMREFTRSYRKMARFAQKLGSSQLLSRSDMQILGRKLQANFDRKPGKIDVLNQGMAPNVSQQKVTLHQVPTRQRGQYLWAAYVDLPAAQPKHYPPPLKHGRGFLEVLLWSHLNGLLTGHLHVPVYTRRSHLTDFEVKELMSSFRHSLSHPLPTAPQTAYRNPSRIARLMLYANVGVDPMASLSNRGLQKISSRVDSLDYSALGENLVRTLDMVTVSSWQEVVVSRYTGRESLIQCLQGLFTQLQRQQDAPLPEIEVHCYCPSRSTAIAQRVEQLVNDMMNAFFLSSDGGMTRYLMRIEQTFYLCQFIEGRLYAEPADSVRQLYPLLAREQQAFSPLILDRNSMIRHSALRLILESPQPGHIVVCFQADRKHIHYWVLDEVGTLFQARAVNHGVSNLLNHLYRFLRNVELQQMPNEMDSEASDLVMRRRRTRFFEVRPTTATTRAKLRSWPGAEDDELDSHHIQVMVDKDPQQSLYYTLYVGDEEFSSLVLGDSLLQAVADRIRSLRGSGERYPCYINDLQFSEEVLAGFQGGRAQTYHYLKYKYRLEQQLNRLL